MKDIRFTCSYALTESALQSYKEETLSALRTLTEGTGAGNDFLGWLGLPKDIRSQVKTIQQTADRLRRDCDIIVCVGIGGSYLGAKAVIDALQPSFAWLEDRKPQIVYAGNNIGEDYLCELQDLLRNKNFGIICISKSSVNSIFLLLNTSFIFHFVFNLFISLVFSSL